MTLANLCGRRVLCLFRPRYKHIVQLIVAIRNIFVCEQAKLYNNNQSFTTEIGCLVIVL